MPKRLLIVEDEAVTALDLKSELVDLGYEVAGLTDNANDAVRMSGQLKPALVLMDIHIAGPVDGIAAARVIRDSDDLPVVFLTAHSDDATLARALQAAPFGYVLKPFQVRELKVTIELALYKHQKEREVRHLAQELEASLSKVKQLSGLLPICAACKKIRDDDGSWIGIEDYVRSHSEAEFSHGLCPECVPKFFPGLPPGEHA